ncbi:MAG TPA: glycosyltransferase family A protein [Albitalea sp.]|nr:glycosyltransferase family A protein [Albitalea sp.]
MTVRISVVIPTFHRPELLARCLGAVLAQRFDPGACEVIVVDDGHDEATREQVQAMAPAGGQPAVRYLRPGNGRGPAVARNAGWRAARGALVAFTDDDTVPDPNWLAEGEREMDSRVAVCGRVVVPPLDEPPTDHELMTRGLASAEFVTANAFVRRDALEQVGGFDERFTRAWREDSDLQFRLCRLGEVARSDRSTVLHPVRPERWGVCLRQQRNTFFDALLYKKHPRLYRERIRRVPPWNYYFIVLLVLAAPVLTWSGLGIAAAAALSIALALIARLAVERLRHTARTPSHVAEMIVTSALIPFLSVYWRLRGAWRFRVLFL